MLIFRNKKINLISDEYHNIHNIMKTTKKYLFLYSKLQKLRLLKLKIDRKK